MFVNTNQGIKIFEKTINQFSKELVFSNVKKLVIIINSHIAIVNLFIFYI
jgi:hypothetical protein